MAFVQANGSGGSGTSLTCAFLSNNTAANFLAVCLSHEIPGTDAITDSRNSYVNDVPVIVETDVSTGLWSAMNIGAGANTVTATGGGSLFRGLAIGEWSEVQTTGAFDRSASATGFGTSMNSGNTATTQASSELLIGAIGGGNPAFLPLTAGASFTKQVSGGTTKNATLEDRTVSAPAAYNATATASSSANWVAIIATYRLDVFAVLTGTAIGGITEADVVAGGKVITVTLTGETFVAN